MRRLALHMYAFFILVARIGLVLSESAPLSVRGARIDLLNMTSGGISSVFHGFHMFLSKFPLRQDRTAFVWQLDGTWRPFIVELKAQRRRRE